MSAGTERLFYRGAGSPPDDPTLSDSGGRAAYPLRYGYAAVGTIVSAGASVAPSTVGQRVFAYAPHQSAFVCELDAVVPVPTELGSDSAALLATMETAVTLLMDGAPVIGERIAVIGQGSVGLLTAALCTHSTAGEVFAVDPLASRLELSRAVCGPNVQTRAAIDASTRGGWAPGFDLVFEVSSTGAGLQLGLDLLRPYGRLVIGSWYPDPTVQLRLDAATHRNRQSITFSQVSTLPPTVQARFDRRRRHQVAMDWLHRLPVESIITHRVALDDAETLYRDLDGTPEQFGQVLLVYDGDV